MMQSYLICHLWGPLQSWGGTGAIGEVRNAGQHPGKSAIIGLLGAALGYERGDAELYNLQESLHSAVHVLQSGHRFTDFHTVQSPVGANTVWQTRREELNHKRVYTTVSRRDYFTDACFRVVLWGKVPDYDLQPLFNALRKPHFPMYLGRRACPLGLPLGEQLVEAENVLDAIKQVGHLAKKQAPTDADPFAESLTAELFADDDATEAVEQVEQPGESEVTGAAAARAEVFANLRKQLNIGDATWRGEAGWLYSDIQLENGVRKQMVLTQRDNLIAKQPRRFAIRSEYVYHLQPPRQEA